MQVPNYFTNMNFLADDDNDNENTVSSEIDRYLAEPLEKQNDVDNLVLWWYNRRSTYPRLSRMAMDYHTVPGE